MFLTQEKVVKHFYDAILCEKQTENLDANTYFVDFSEVLDADSVTANFLLDTVFWSFSKVVDVVSAAGLGSFCAEQLDAKTIQQNTMTNFMKSIVLLLMLLML